MHSPCRENLVGAGPASRLRTLLKIEAKLTYVRLNTQTACPPRTAVPVSTRAWLGVFHSARPDRFRSWMRLPQLCRSGLFPKRAARSTAFRSPNSPRDAGSSCQSCDWKQVKKRDRHGSVTGPDAETVTNCQSNRSGPDLLFSVARPRRRKNKTE